MIFCSRCEVVASEHGASGTVRQVQSLSSM
nr:MAG TPA: hypothetical protein [Caudoviricetes sp.]